MKRAALYVRVSTDEQKKHGLSVDNQIVALKEYCQNNGYQIVNVYNDAGISARKKYTKRPALLQLINDCENGKIDLILFTKLDRWFRSVADYYQVQQHLDNCKVPWRAIWEDYETETSAGVFKVNIMLSVAQAEADRTGERIRATFDYKRARGDYVGTPPLGYKRVNNKLVINPESEHIIRLIFDVYVKTHSTSAVMKKMISENIKISTSKIDQVLRSETYCGNAYGSACEAYITPEEHANILAIRQSNFRIAKNNHTYLFSTLCVCGECNKKMRGLAAKNGNKIYKNYFCTGQRAIDKHENRVSLSEAKLERYMLRELDELLENYNCNISVKQQSSNYEKDKKALENKLERVGIRFEEGDISAQEYKEKRKAILAEIASLNPETRNKKIELPSNWQDAYSELDEPHKQAFWFSIIKSITINGKGVITVDFV